MFTFARELRGRSEALERRGIVVESNRERKGFGKALSVGFWRPGDRAQKAPRKECGLHSEIRRQPNSEATRNNVGVWWKERRRLPSPAFFYFISMQRIVGILFIGLAIFVLVTFRNAWGFLQLDTTKI